MKDSKYDKRPEEGISPYVMEIVKIVGDAGLGFVWPVE
jgi:hypothetical protein